MSSYILVEVGHCVTADYLSAIPEVSRVMERVNQGLVNLLGLVEVIAAVEQARRGRVFEFHPKDIESSLRQLDLSASLVAFKRLVQATDSLVPGNSEAAESLADSGIRLASTPQDELSCKVVLSITPQRRELYDSPMQGLGNVTTVLGDKDMTSKKPLVVSRSIGQQLVYSISSVLWRWG